MLNDYPTLTPEILVPMLGELLVEKGFLTSEDLTRALDVQHAMRQKGEYSLLGQVLIDLGMIDAATRDKVTTEHIMQLKAALQEANQQLSESNQQLEHRVQERTAELEQAMAKLAELNQLKANIVANISHELRTPLTHLKGYLELLLAGDLGPVNESQVSALQVMDKSSDRLGRLIEDLILFSVSERDQIHLNLTSFQLAPLLANTIHNSDAKAREHGISLLIDCPPSLPLVQGDEEKITWVILQLLDNAIKFTPTGGHVSVRVTCDNLVVNITISDTGIGIPASRINEIFDSFYQLDGSTTRRVGGTGLGLALAKKLIEAHGSSIRVNSEVGRGSCFGFSLIIHTNDSE
jgi:signal transduction histidine kinase